MTENNLGTWRRTIYSNEINPSLDGKEVIIMGWVSSVRDHGNLIFMMITDKNGDIQITAKKGVCNEEIRQEIVKLKEQSSVAIKGIIKPSNKAPHGAEIAPLEMKIFSQAEKVAPFTSQAKTVANIDTRLEIRAIDLRRNILQHVFKARSLVLK